MRSFPDVVAGEETVDVPLLEHPGPKKVLVVAGFNPAIIRELGKYSRFITADFVELDPALPRLVRRLMGSKDWKLKYNVFIEDARVFVKNTINNTTNKGIKDKSSELDIWINQIKETRGKRGTAGWWQYFLQIVRYYP